MRNGRRLSMVERYLNGRMTDADARDFQRRLETDPKLREILHQEEEIERAFYHDCKSIPPPGSQWFEQLLRAGARPGSGNSHMSLGMDDVSRNGGGRFMLSAWTERVVRNRSGRDYVIVATIMAVVAGLLFFLLRDDGPAVPRTVISPAEPAAPVPWTQGSHSEAGAPLPVQAGETGTSTFADAADAHPDDVADGQAAIAPSRSRRSAHVPARVDTTASADTVAWMLVPPDPIVLKTDTAMKYLYTDSLRSMEDTVESIRRFMEDELNRQEPEIEQSDSIRTSVKIQN